MYLSKNAKLEAVWQTFGAFHSSGGAFAAFHPNSPVWLFIQTADLRAKDECVKFSFSPDVQTSSHSAFYVLMTSERVEKFLSPFEAIGNFNSCRFLLRKLEESFSCENLTVGVAEAS